MSNVRFPILWPPEGNVIRSRGQSATASSLLSKRARSSSLLSKTSTPRLIYTYIHIICFGVVVGSADSLVFGGGGSVSSGNSRVPFDRCSFRRSRPTVEEGGGRRVEGGWRAEGGGRLSSSLPLLCLSASASPYATPHGHRDIHSLTWDATGYAARTSFTRRSASRGTSASAREKQPRAPGAQRSASASAAPGSAQWSAMERNGMEWNGMERNGMEWNGTEWNGTE